MAKTWADIPNFENTSYSPFDVDKHFGQLYEKRKVEYDERYKGKYLEDELADYKRELDQLKNEYKRVYNNLFTTFVRDLKEGKSESKVSMNLYDPDDYHGSDERFYREKAWTDFYLELKQRNYPYRFYDEKGGVVTRHLTITLK